MQYIFECEHCGIKREYKSAITRNTAKYKHNKSQKHIHNVALKAKDAPPLVQKVALENEQMKQQIKYLFEQNRQLRTIIDQIKPAFYNLQA